MPRRAPGAPGALPSHIIERPRLVSFLERISSGAILLVAPAGYGKTVLARQWIASCGLHYAWYTVTKADRDVAALAAGVSRTLGTRLPQIESDLRSRLYVSPSAANDVEALIDILREGIRDWPTDSWLVIDDYHQIAGSALAERLFEGAVLDSHARIVVASRSVPSWANTRRQVYGAITIVDGSLLAMTEDEVKLALGLDEASPAAATFSSRTRGWPAVVGLAALTQARAAPLTDNAAALYAFFAAELYERIPEHDRLPLLALSLPPKLTTDLASIVVAADDVPRLLLTATNEGFFSLQAEGSLEIHPLLQEFLRQKLRQDVPLLAQDAAGRLIDHYILTEQWDDAFAVIEQVPLHDALVALMRAAALPLLRDARLATLESWLTFARDRRWDHPVLDFVQAQVAHLQGDHAAGEAFSLRAAERLPETEPLSARAYLSASLSAHLRGMPDNALKYAQIARGRAVDDELKRECLWREFLASMVLEEEDTENLLDQLLALDDGSTEFAIRMICGRLFLNRYFSLSIVEPLAAAEAHLPVAPAALDPGARSSFFTTLGYSLSFVARYSDALRVAEAGLADAEASRLSLGLPHLLHVKALALLGLREFAKASRTVVAGLDHARARDASVTHLLLTRARIDLAERRPEQALAAAEAAIDDTTPQNFVAEALACQAIAHAALGNREEVLDLSHRATQLSRGAEAHVLAAFATAAIAIETTGINTDVPARDAFKLTLRTGYRDGFVTAYRLFPVLLHSITAERPWRAAVANTLIEARDWRLARRVQIHLSPLPAQARQLLSLRETEVIALIGDGLTNADIARTLFISEVTVKAHIRHIFLKLGARTRTEAVRKAALL